MLDDVDDRTVEPDFHEDDAARHKIDGVVTELGMRQPGDKRGVRIPHAHVAEHDAGQQRAADFADLDRARHRTLHGRACDPGEQRAARLRADQRVQRTEETGQQSDERPERDTE